MRRKSERNKPKGSPEKKVEKPTRKSTRRRGRRSPSTSPDRSSNDTELAKEKIEKEKEKRTIKTRLQSKEIDSEKPEEELKTISIVEIEKISKETSSLTTEISDKTNDKLKVDDGDKPATEDGENGSVWKAASGDASAGEIPKLKLSRQRNLSETSDVSSGRIRNSEKISEDNDGIAEEVDFADDKTQVISSIVDNTSDSTANDVSSAMAVKNPKTSEEVSDIKEKTPEKPSAEFSDDKPKLDRQDEEDRPTAIDHQPTDKDDKDDNKDEKEKEADVKKNLEGFNSSENEENEEDLKDKDEHSGSADDKKRIVLQRANRRKHRDKYRDSSNSDSEDSGEETNIQRNVQELELSREHSPVVKGETTTEQPEVVNTILDSLDEDPKINNLVKSEATEQQSKPTKINLKRTLTRISADTLGSRKDEEVKDATQNKENHVGADQDPNIIPKKRRWGTAPSTDMTPAFSISTDSLKALVPGAKPLSISEVRLSKDDEDDSERRKDREKHFSPTEGLADKVKEDETANKPDNHIALRRKISIVRESTNKSPSPPPVQLTNILLIKNLVRPFTIHQIKELLSRTGTIVENGFWMDGIKSKCFVEYLNEDQAFETRQALHGISWPPSNPKKLNVEYSTKEEMEKAIESSKDEVPLRKNEMMASSNVWQQDWTREDKQNAPAKVIIVREWDLGKEDGQHLIKEKEREKKDEKKRRQRSRSPQLDPHLPAPARKFKKKEDEPPPAKLLDDLFRKTKATPCIYWLPLTNEQIIVNEEMRRQRVAEHARRMEEIRRANRNRDIRRRRSPRK